MPLLCNGRNPSAPTDTSFGQRLQDCFAGGKPRICTDHPLSADCLSAYSFFSLSFAYLQDPFFGPAFILHKHHNICTFLCQWKWYPSKIHTFRLDREGNKKGGRILFHPFWKSPQTDVFSYNLFAGDHPTVRPTVPCKAIIKKPCPKQGGVLYPHFVLPTSDSACHIRRGGREACIPVLGSNSMNQLWV